MCLEKGYEGKKSWGNGYTIGEYSYKDRNLLGTRLKSQLLERDRKALAAGRLDATNRVRGVNDEIFCQSSDLDWHQKHLGVNFILRLAWSRVTNLTLFRLRERDVRTQASGVAFCVAKIRVYWSFVVLLGTPKLVEY